MKMKIILLLFITIFSLSIINAQYKEPPESIMEVLNIERTPLISYAPFSTIGFEYNFDPMPPLKRIAQPSKGLGGISISPRINAVPRNTLYNHFAIIYFETEEYYQPDMDLQKGIRSFKLSPDRKHCVLSLETENGIVLYIININDQTYYRIPDLYINDVFGNDGFYWIDNSNLYISKIPNDRGNPPEEPRVPVSPIIDETAGTTSSIITYQNLLNNTHDIELFDYYFSLQPSIFNIEQEEITNIGTPGIYNHISISPDNNYILVSRINKPYSYIFPYFFFPRTYEIWDMEGNIIRIIHSHGLLDDIPQGGVQTGPRRISWQPRYDSALVWAEALDEGDPQIEAEHRDRIMRLKSPLDNKPEELIRTKHRFSNIEWSEKKDICIIMEYDRDRVWITSHLLDISINKKETIFDMSARDLYNNPGDLIKISTDRNENVFIHRDNSLYFNNQRGATPEGNFPYIGRYCLDEGEMHIIYRSRENAHEQIIGFFGDGFDSIFISSEKPDSPRNYFIIHLDSGKRKQITFHEDPYPHITSLKKEIVTYTRSDGVNLSGTLYYPLNYEEGQRVPLIINAYPREFTDASIAEQLSLSPNRFISFWGASTLYLTLEGYAVLQGASIPIVGDPQTVNDTFIKQTVSSVEAAIEYLDKREIIDPDRVGITGHSYGAFMVATVLGNSDICAAGIARSGAYNRTLTPFGFQAERRFLWDAKDFYIEVSPFMYADRINKPILFIHGQEDSNSGTYPLQTERMFQAVKGTGGTARMVILPHEGHGYSARESIMHVLAEKLAWFDKYVKNRDE